jgi:hypothetical protein
MSYSDKVKKGLGKEKTSREPVSITILWYLTLDDALILLHMYKSDTLEYNNERGLYVSKYSEIGR